MSSGTPRRRSAAEWVTFALSVAVVGALILVALIEESKRREIDETNLQVTFDMERATAQGNSFYVPYTVRNVGSEAVSEAEIWFDIYAGERLTASAEINVSFLPQQGTQDGVFVTTYDPDTHTIKGRLESVQFP